MLLPPSRAPTNTQKSSANAKFKAIFHPVTGTQIVEVETGKLLWKLPAWYRWAFLSDDGEKLVTSYDGGNLIPLDAKDDTVVLSFFKDRLLIKEIKLKDLFPDPKKIPKDMGYSDWGSPVGFNKLGFEVKLATGEKVIFNVSTGEVLPKEPRE